MKIEKMYRIVKKSKKSKARYAQGIEENDIIKVVVDVTPQTGYQPSYKNIIDIFRYDGGDFYDDENFSLISGGVRITEFNKSFISTKDIETMIDFLRQRIQEAEETLEKDPSNRTANYIRYEEEQLREHKNSLTRYEEHNVGSVVLEEMTAREIFVNYYQYYADELDGMIHADDTTISDQNNDNNDTLEDSVDNVEEVQESVDYDFDNESDETKAMRMDIAKRMGLDEKSARVLKFMNVAMMSKK